MILVYSLSRVDAAENGDGERVLNDADKGLQHNEDHRGEAEDAVWRDKMGVVAFVDFDDGEGAEETHDADQLDGGVDACS